MVVDQPFAILQGHQPSRLNQSNDDDSVDTFNDGIPDNFDTVKSEENEFSDTEDMLEGGVVDKVQNAVDNYIENNSNEVDDIITLSNPQNQINIAIDGEEKDWYQTSSMSSNIVFETNEMSEEKPEPSDLLVNENSGSQHSYHQTNGHMLHDHQLLNDSMEQLPNSSNGGKMTVIYEINEIDGETMPGHFSVVDQNGHSRFFFYYSSID